MLCENSNIIIVSFNNIMTRTTIAFDGVIIQYNNIVYYTYVWGDRERLISGDLTHTKETLGCRRRVYLRIYTTYYCCVSRGTYIIS